MNNPFCYLFFRLAGVSFVGKIIPITSPENACYGPCFLDFPPHFNYNIGTVCRCLSGLEFLEHPLSDVV